LVAGAAPPRLEERQTETPTPVTPTDTDTPSPSGTDGSAPGFGVVAALAAVATLAVGLRRRK
jgi:PGF-CTERM protein